MKKLIKLSAALLAITILAGFTSPPPVSASNTSRTNVTLSVTDGVPKQNPFSLDRGGKYMLYTYDRANLAYNQLGYAYWTTQDVRQPELEAAIDAINALPVLKEADKNPTSNAKYGLMAVSADGAYKKTQFYLYEDLLTVNTVPYAINNEQYQSLKKVMEVNPKAKGTAIPQWFVYMNPSRVKSITCTDADGKMQKIKKANVLNTAINLTSINVKSGKTYKAGSKSFDKMPFSAVYTFDSKVTYTVWVSNVKNRAENVTIYVESSDMDYGCEYVVDGFISSYVQYAQEAVNGEANPLTGGV